MDGNPFRPVDQLAACACPLGKHANAVCVRSDFANKHCCKRLLPFIEVAAFDVIAQNQGGWVALIGLLDPRLDARAAARLLSIAPAEQRPNVGIVK